MKPHLSFDDLERVIHAFIFSRLDYCNYLYIGLGTVIDPEGGFLIGHLSIQNMNLCIANIYGPNVDDPSFFSLHSLITQITHSS